jgi:transcriptional regulator with XRE-family HTH domain
MKPLAEQSVSCAASRGYTQEAVALKAGVNRSHMSMIERGDSRREGDPTP